MCIRDRVHTIPEVMKMKQGEQKSTKELEEQAKNVETFNPDVYKRQGNTIFDSAG